MKKANAAIRGNANGLGGAQLSLAKETNYGIKMRDKWSVCNISSRLNEDGDGRLMIF